MIVLAFIRFLWNHVGSHLNVTLASLIQEGERLLQQANVEFPRREVMLLIAAALQKSRTELFLMDKACCVDPTIIRSYFYRRSQHEPFAYIVGEQGFWSLDLDVSQATLIPRADSEALIEVLLKTVPERQASYRFLDLGTGTGCLLLAALSEYPNSFGIGVDYQEQAARLAKNNAQKCQLAERSVFFTGYWGDALKGRFDVILSNPPYIREHELLTLMPDVKDYEPMSALDGGKDGLNAYRYICRQSADLLSDQGVLIVELGIEQEQAVIHLAGEVGLYVVQKQQDLNGYIRALVFSRLKL